MLKKSISIFECTLLSIMAISCGHSNQKSESHGDEIITMAHTLSIMDYPGYSCVTVRNADDSTNVKAVYYLISQGNSLPDSIDTSGATIIQVPLKHSLVYSNVHVSLLHELGSIDAVKGVCDGTYVTDSIAIRRLADGSIIDCGDSRNPNIEAVMQLSPDGILLSSYGQNPGQGKISQLGIPVIEADDYLEPTPLGRAEWMKFYGRLYGKGMEADSLFRVVAEEYKSIRDKTSKTSNRPKVLFDGVYGDSWYIPTSGSATGRLISDAGGLNPFAYLKDAGSDALSPEQVIYKAHDADVWFVRYFKPEGTKSLDEWAAENKNYSHIKAFTTGNVYGSNTAYSGIFDDGAFHPQLILAEMASILHPEIKDIAYTGRYYSKMR